MQEMVFPLPQRSSHFSELPAIIMRALCIAQLLQSDAFYTLYLIFIAILRGSHLTIPFLQREGGKKAQSG